MPKTNSSVIKQLEELRAKRRGKVRERKVWTALLQSESRDDLAVGLDYATENELIDGYFAPHFRGEPVETVADRYWVHPITRSEMVWIPAGAYPVGEEAVGEEAVGEEAVGEEGRSVEIQGFFLARYPVTNQQYYEFMEESGYVADPGLGLGEVLLGHWDEGVPDVKCKEHPVVWVSYYDAMAYCEHHRMCLPTEWQWEAAARGMDGREYPWGSSGVASYKYQRGKWSVILRAHLSSEATVPVDEFPQVRTPFGCEQLIGNVSEWCALPEAREHEDDQYDDHLRPVRGSCYKRSGNGSIASSHRRFLSAGRRNDWVGFRPALAPSAF